jgi:hypothetical protein
MIKMKIVKYMDIERVLGKFLILYKDRVYKTKENMRDCPQTITLLDNGLSEDDFAEITQDRATEYNGGN